MKVPIDYKLPALLFQCLQLKQVNFFRHVYSSKSFILPVVIVTVLYNIPKFFELYVHEFEVKTCHNETGSYNLTGPATTINNSR